MKSVKVLFLFSLLLLSITSCKVHKKDLTLENLINQIVVETGCSKENIILENMFRSTDGKHNETYAFNVCGKRMIYKRVGSVYLNSETVESMFNR